jgi:hypothetical protein
MSGFWTLDVNAYGMSHLQHPHMGRIFGLLQVDRSPGFDEQGRRILANQGTGCSAGAASWIMPLMNRPILWTISVEKLLFSAWTNIVVPSRLVLFVQSRRQSSLMLKLVCRLVRSFKLDLVQFIIQFIQFLNDFFLSLPSNTRYSNPATSLIPLHYYYYHYYTVQVLNKKVSR